MKRIDQKTMRVHGPWMALWLTIAVLAVIATGQRWRSGTSSAVVEIINPDQSLITAMELKEEIENIFGFDLSGAMLQNLDLLEIEDAMSRHHLLEDLQVYIDASNQVRFKVRIREPVGRLYSTDGLSYYLDRTGAVFMANASQPVRTIIVSGHLPVTDTSHIGNSALIRDLHTLLTIARTEPFYNALIEQVVVRNDGEYLILPKVGTEKILIGTMDNVQGKLLKMREFYKKEMTKGNWGQYEIIDLRYKNQVIAVNKTQA